MALPLPASIPAAFAAMVATHGDCTAIIGDVMRLSYRELDQRSDALAEELIDSGIGAGATVGLYLGRSPEAIVALVGILKTGAAYVPYDTGYPSQLLAQLIEDSAPSAMIVAGGRTPPGWSGTNLRVALDSGASTAKPVPPISREDLAYLMYTSGSTGRPKGVRVPHRAVVRLVVDTDYVSLGPDQVILQLAPLSFDASTFEIWGALLTGGSLAIPAVQQPSLDDIAAAIERFGVTTAWFTAGLFHLLVDHQLPALGRLSQLLAGGDVLSPSHVRRLLEAAPACRLINGYGPTENTTFSCCHRVELQDLSAGAIPIGRAIARSSAWVVDDDGLAVADGVDGELYVGGEGLALGYHRLPELTADRFLSLPLAPVEKLYRTGDRVRRRADGIIEFLGRNDRQLKISGKRVELDAIESVLRQLEGVVDAAVAARDTHGGKRIEAWIVPTAGVGGDSLRAALRERLPDYMIPATLSPIPAMPLSPTGKIDRAALLRLPPPEVGPTDRNLASLSGLERDLLAIWREVLGSEAVGVDDNFFDVGGSSLLLIRAHALIGSSLGRDIALLELMRHPRVRSLARALTGPEPRPVATAAISPRERARLQQKVLVGARPGRNPS